MGITSINDAYDYYCNGGCVDIIEHLPTLKQYASKCESVVEMGVRGMVSTWALLAGRPKKMISIDIEHPNTYNNHLELAERFCKADGIDFKFIQEDTLKVKIPQTDLLFIDTLHTYDQLKKELTLHGNKAMRYLIFHDTVSCPELLTAILEFTEENAHWKYKEHYTNNNGLQILERLK